MEDDFNTADAIAAIFEIVKLANTNTDAESTKAFVQFLFDKIVGLSDILGLIVNKKEEVLDEEVEKLIEERQAARKAKDFAKAEKSVTISRYGNYLKRYQRRSTMEASLSYLKELICH